MEYDKALAVSAVLAGDISLGHLLGGILQGNSRTASSTIYPTPTLNGGTGRIAAMASAATYHHAMRCMQQQQCSDKSPDYMGLTTEWEPAY